MSSNACALFCTLSIYLTRFIVDASIAFLIKYIYDVYETQQRIPLRPDETMERFGQRKIALRCIEATVWNQEKWFDGGEDTKKWFIEHIKQIPVQRLHLWQNFVVVNGWHKNISESQYRAGRMQFEKGSRDSWYP